MTLPRNKSSFTFCIKKIKLGTVLALKAAAAVWTQVLEVAPFFSCISVLFSFLSYSLDVLSAGLQQP